MERGYATSEEYLQAVRAVGRMVLEGAPCAAVSQAQNALEDAEARTRDIALPVAQLRDMFSLTRAESLLLAACAERLFSGGRLPGAAGAARILAENGFVGTPSALFAGGLHPFVTDWLLERAPRALPGLLFDWCGPEKLYHSHAVLEEMDAFVQALSQGETSMPAAVVLCGPQGSGRRFLFSRLAERQACPLVILDGTAPVAAQDVLVAARLYGALVCVAQADAARESAQALAGEMPLLLYEAGDELPPLEAACVLRRDVQPPTTEESMRALCDWCGVSGGEWERALALFHPEMGALRRAARRLAAERAAGAEPAPQTLRKILCERGAAALRGCAQRMETGMRLADLVLPGPAMEQFLALRDFARVQEKVMNSWGFAKKASYGRGLTALFYGASGTGKTMAAGVLANELGMELYRVDLSQMISKYVGETQKNIGRVFDQARDSGSILFFDEADALFARRSEAADAQDKYANAEVAYLLQRTEQHDGIILLATNLLQNFDEAFRRRIGFMIHFSLPDAALRRRLWEQIFPQEAPVEALEPEVLAQQLELSGAGIRSVALSAARLAASQEKPITMRGIVQAARMEYQKQGKTFPQKLELMYSPERGTVI